MRPADAAAAATADTVPVVYEFAREPKWIVGHVLAAVLLITFAGAAFWQLDRHRARVAQNDRITERATLPPLGVDGLLAANGDDSFRLSSVSGRWQPDELVVIRNRSQNAFAGCHVVVPLRVHDSATDEPNAVAVNVGWLPERDCDTTALRVAMAASAEEPTTVDGRVRETQTRGLLGPRDPADGSLDSLARVDVERLDEQTSSSLAPLFLEATAIDPAPPILAEFVEPPAPDNGPHLGYAGQWAMFFLVGALGYPLVLRRQARLGEREALS